MFIKIILLLLMTCFHVVFNECRVVTKEEWGGQTCSRVNYLPRPIDLVIIMETGTSRCNNEEKCMNILQNLQKTHMERHSFADIGYSFMIDSNGGVYEGSGWLHSGNHTEGYNDRSIGVGFIGVFDRKSPKQAGIKSLKVFLKCGIRNGHLAPNYKIVAHRQLIASENPGMKLFEKVRSLKRWEDVLELFYK